ncbi:MAG: bifunctional (p)ppGpp synthetase/guanosine-3',5'-bis(diphosphate) 3'-pyrophosphohydrolase, partial [Deltaproteobacteria bacterium]|nr:bifunctional (p)ppGpp synthetase/guanosine-3',5'-bis(diphosphate) 3'-pyrophosphohydrolase [Deltaproteobacteria bacterium]
MVRISDILDAFLKKYPEGDVARIQRAYLLSAKKHEGQIRKSGEPYMIHPLAVAKTIAEMGLDDASIAAALLHDTVEDTGTTREEIAKMFGDEIASLVDGVTKLSAVNFTRKEERQAESFRKMLIAMSKDIRVLLLKLADRLHNMQTLGHMSPEGQERIAQETRDIYAPLANRLGIAWMKAELDDLAFKHLELKAYEEIAAKVSGTRVEREEYIARTCAEITQFLKEAGYEVRVSGRIKNLYSIHQKMVKKTIDFEQVYDAIAFRVICDTLASCYAILGMVHSRWVPLPGRFKDFIAIPKPNRYQSLHTTVVVGTGERIEIQIRTDAMHKIAEDGIAAHWTYKESKVSAPLVSAFAWLREMVESQDGVRDSEEFLDSVKVDLFTDEVFVFTPRGDIMSLPEGATPLDFAYAIHTEVGNHCAGARVSGVQVPLRHTLRSGDWVEIVTSKTQRPSSDWLDFVVTGRAQNKIRAFLRAEQLRQSREFGHQLLERALRHYGCSLAKI